MNSIELDSEDIMKNIVMKSNKETSNDTLNPKSGIYKIVNKVDGKYYVGSTKDFNNRWRTHKSTLSKNIHPNDYLQRAWNKYGEQSFEFIIIELTNSLKTTLLEVEQCYLDIAKTEHGNCYNLNYKSNGGELSEYSIDKIRQKALKREYPSWKEKYTDIERKEKWGKPLSENANWRGGVSIKICPCGKKMDYYSTTCMECRPNSVGWKGKKHSMESKSKMSIAQKGRNVSESTKSIKKIQNSGMNNPNADLSVYQWKNILTEEIFMGTRYEFRKIHNISVDSDKGIVKCEYKQTKSGWTLSKRF